MFDTVEAAGGAPEDLRVLGTAAATYHQSTKVCHKYMAIQAPFLDVSISPLGISSHVNETMRILLKANYRVTHQVGSNLK